MHELNEAIARFRTLDESWLAKAAGAVGHAVGRAKLHFSLAKHKVKSAYHAGHTKGRDLENLAPTRDSSKAARKPAARKPTARKPAANSRAKRPQAGGFRPFTAKKKKRAGVPVARLVGRRPLRVLAGEKRA